MKRLIVGAAILISLLGSRAWAEPVPSYIEDSVGEWLIATDDGVKVGATYEATEEKIAKVDGFISETGEDSALRKATYEESEGWYAGITADMFG